MKHSRISLTVVLATLVLLLAACGSQPEATEGLNKEAATALSRFAPLSQDRLIAMMPGTGLSSLVFNGGQTLPKQVVSLLPQHGLNALSAEETDCITFEGDLTDADLDDIPVDATFTFDCAYSEEGSDFTIVGSARFQDANDADALSGYVIDFVDFIVTETKDGQTNALELNQHFVLAIDDDKSLYVIENALELTATTPEGSSSYSELAALGYAPDDVADPFAAGTFALNGLTTWQSGEDVYQLSEIAPALHYSATCESGFDAGAVSYEDSFGNTLVFIFNACNDVTVIYNGSPL